MTQNLPNYWNVYLTANTQGIVYRYKTQFLRNYYKNNYASGDKGIISINGLQIFDFKNEKFELNGDSYSEILDNAGGNFFAINTFRYN